MKKVLLVSHGEMAIGTKKAVEMIAGKSDNLDALCLSEDGNIEQLKATLESKINTYGDNQVVVVADLMGGSPYIATIDVLTRQKRLENSFVVAGMNLPLVLSLVMADEVDKGSIKAMIEDSKNYILLFEENDDDEVDF
ncbi:MAG: PTS sugar transporter subunit IIA [Anaerorhabdus sp.]